MKHFRDGVNADPWYDRTRPTAPGNTQTDYDPRLVVAGPEIEDI